MKLYLFIINFLLIIFFSNNSSAGNQPSCNGNFSYNHENFKNTHKIEYIKVDVLKNKKFQKNNIRNLISRKKGIQDRFKKKFDAKILVQFDNNLKCTFLGKVRQNGDMRDHIVLKENKIFQSLDVELKNGHINGIVKFKLFLKNSRNIKEDEIIMIEILRSLDYLAPRTALVKANINGAEDIMIFQEKTVKEMLEFNHRREGSILEGSEKFFFEFQSNIDRDGTAQYKETIQALENGTKIQLARLSNSNWSMKSLNHLEISLNSLSKLNQIYLLYLNNYKNSKNNFSFTEYSLSNNLLANKKNENIQKLNIFDILMVAGGAQHGLFTHNRKFYWNSFDNYFEPIYYDGSPDLNKRTENFGWSTFYWLPIHGNILADLNTLIKKLDELDYDKMLKNLNKNGLDFSYNQLENKILKLKSNIKDVENKINNTNIEVIDFNKKLFYKRELWDNFINNFRNLNLNVEFILSNNKSKNIDNFDNQINFSKCKNNFTTCENLNLNIHNPSDRKILRELLEAKLTIDDYYYQFTSKDLNNFLDHNNYKKVQILDSEFYFGDGIEFELNKENNVLNIYQKKLGARAYFYKGNLQEIRINFHGFINPETFKEVNIINKIPNYPIDLNGLTGCLSFIKVNFNNVEINSTNSNCEDSVNLIDVKGSINKIDISNSLSDGLDVDFSNIKIKNINIFSSGNDCSDFSSGIYEINKFNLQNCGDKSLSVGEKSFLKLNRIMSSNSNVGIASKDSSIVKLNEGFFSKLNTCLSAYNKKQEFNGGYIYAKKIECKNFNTNILNDLYSEIKIENQL